MQQNKPIRRGQLISPWGVGSMVNFPGDETLMVCGLDAWENIFQNASDGYKEFEIREERLERRLGVSSFRFPPDYREPGSGIKNPSLKIPFIRFPRWHYCPKCGAMEQLQIYGSKQKCKGPIYTGGMCCHAIAERKRSYLIPVRFIAICGHGHIEDFPFLEWVHKDNSFGSDCALRLRAGRSSISLSGIEISCRCGARKTMATAFNEKSLVNVKSCNGLRPWLGEIHENTNGWGMELKVVQRGASNVYFPELRSSIYLPKWNKNVKRRIVEILERDWEILIRSRVNGELNQTIFEAFAAKYGVDANELLNAAKERMESEAQNHDVQQIDSEEMYRKTEYDAILSGTGGDNQDFYVTNKNSNDYESVIGQYFTSISLIHKLRETRTLVGFSRWLPEAGRSIQTKMSDLALSQRINWLPAIIVRGEGVFFDFDSEKLCEWGRQKEVQMRANILISNYNRERINRGQRERIINSKFILLHTFAHIIINQFSFECGYGSSSLRERIYCDAEFPENPMNGILIYTASGDSEGSLGGLVRQGKSGNLENIVNVALDKAQWCSADPICINSNGQGPDSCNLAACHNCALLPETCCEEGNKLMDRAMIIGTLENSEIGYFNGHSEVN